MSSKFYFYKAHGLRIKSSIPLPGLLSKQTKHDIIIHFQNLSHVNIKQSQECDLSINIKAKITEDIIYLIYENIILCKINLPDEIILNDSTSFHQRFFQLIIIGIAIPILLQKKGNLVLHGNTINIKGKGIAFIGPRGAGKSTTSIALQKKGYNLLSDDISCIKINQKGTAKVFSGFPFVKLWPNVIRGIGENPNLMQKVQLNYDKRFYPPINDFFDTSIPLKSVYLIKKDENTFIEELSCQDAVIELVKSTLYATIFDKEELHHNLKQCTRLALNVPVKILKVEQSIDRLPHLVKTIEDDFLETLKNGL